MPHSLSLSGWPHYFLHLSAVKEVVGNLDRTLKDKPDSDHGNRFFADDASLGELDRQWCQVDSGERTMEAGLQTINKLLLSVIGQPRGNLVTVQTPITQVSQP